LLLQAGASPAMTTATMLIPTLDMLMAPVLG